MDTWRGAGLDRTRRDRGGASLGQAPECGTTVVPARKHAYSASSDCSTAAKRMGKSVHMCFWFDQRLEGRYRNVSGVRTD